VQLAQTTTRAVIGTLELDRTFEEREAISGRVVLVLDEAASKWGVRILRFEIKNLVPPESVRQSMEKQVTAERNRRAIVQKAVGEKQSLINTSEGLKREMINQSEGEKQRRINEAQGKAAETLALGEATAESIRKIDAAISAPGGENAVKLELGQRYIHALRGLKGRGNKVVMGGNLANMNEMLKTLDLEI
jgi:regulator of protease activity HflC (stomatin/prohibitin superfamily)